MILLTNIKKDILSNYSGEFWDCLRHNSLNTNISNIEEIEKVFHFIGEYINHEKIKMVLSKRYNN